VRKLYRKKGLENILGPAVIILAVMVVVVMSTIIIEYNKQKYERIMDISDMITSTQTELYTLLNFNMCPIVEVKYIKCIIEQDEDSCEDRELVYTRDPYKFPLSKWIGIVKTQYSVKLPIYGYDVDEGYNKVTPNFVAYKSENVPSHFIDLERCIRIALQASQIIEDSPRWIEIPVLNMEVCIENKLDINGTCTDEFKDLCGIAYKYDTHVVAYSDTFEDILINYNICTV